MLSYYSLKDEVIIQCDTSWSGLDPALIQLGQPVALALHALIPAETPYAQIEELLNIIYASEKFDAYVYGQMEVCIHSDHKPLEFIFKKPLNTAPMHLQCITKGTDMFLADTPSRVYLTENRGNFVHSLGALMLIEKYLLVLIVYSKFDMPQQKTQVSPF